MQNTLFRKKSLERVSSPEQLHDYMRVTSPAIWMLLGAVIALLAGLLVLASVGRLETRLDVSARVAGGSVTFTMPAGHEKAAAEGQTLRIAGQEIKIESVYTDAEGQTVCTASLEAQDGVYDALLVTDSISPIQFLIN